MRRWLPVLCLLAVAQVARADGVMVVGDRELFREGPKARGYCSDSGSGSPEECEKVLSKILSGYTYGRGYVTGGPTSTGELSGVGWVRASWISADLPGGAMAVAQVDGVIGDEATSRLRLTVLDAETLFVCRDAQRNLWVAPLLGMFTRNCVPRAWLGVEAGLLSGQWDVAEGRLGAEWLRGGPVFELLGNGNGYSHVLRSIQLALPFDLRSVHNPDKEEDLPTTLGVSLRLTAFYRTPAWETRLSVRARTSLTGAESIRSDNSVAGELFLLHNFFLSDAIVMQLGVAFRASWAQMPENTFVVWANAREHFGAFAGVHVGWIHEAPDI
ncbi:MAG TPA: hypothetical protein VJV78_48185 [Polyangiales bacterium]|nr:hypothetical protein [Polyangiales bacterium]